MYRKYILQWELHLEISLYPVRMSETIYGYNLSTSPPCVFRSMVPIPDVDIVGKVLDDEI